MTLIEKLEAKKYNSHDPFNGGNMFDMGIDAAIDLIEEYDPWISVNDAELNKVYVMEMNNGLQHVAQFKGDRFATPFAVDVPIGLVRKIIEIPQTTKP